jgi:CBS domain-containing protein
MLRLESTEAAMKASCVMTREVHCITPEGPLAQAWATLTRLRVRHLPVLFDGRLVGILSDRDLLLRARRRAVLPRRDGG